MTQQMPFSNSKVDKAMSTDQFNLVVEAILAGKYSWACLLILRFAGYNPLHYIPYRTYNRLIKENCQAINSKQTLANSTKVERLSLETKSDEQPSPQGLNKIEDLAYLEAIDKQKTKVRGGTLEQYLYNGILIYEYKVVNCQQNSSACIW